MGENSMRVNIEHICNRKIPLFQGKKCKILEMLEILHYILKKNTKKQEENEGEKCYRKFQFIGD